jgi:hypothetical protein
MKSRTIKPIVAGSLNIISGIICLLVLAILVVIIISVSTPGYQTLPFNVRAAFWFITLPLAIAGVLSLVGGVFCILRRHWGLALAGSISSLLPILVLGIAAIPLIVLSREEFKPG